MKFQLEVPFTIYDPWHRLIKGHRCQHGWKAWEEKQIEKIRFFELGVFEGHLHNATGVDVAKYSTKKLADKCTAQLKAEMQEPICVDYNVSREVLTVTCGYSLKNMYGIIVVWMLFIYALSQ